MIDQASNRNKRKISEGRQGQSARMGEEIGQSIEEFTKGGKRAKSKPNAI
jgi:hypothetical protein